MADPWDDRAVSPLDDDGKQRLKQILEILETSSTAEEQQKILDELKKNPSLMFTFIKNRQDKALRQHPANSQQCLDTPEQERSQRTLVKNQEIDTSKRLGNLDLTDSIVEKSVSEEQE